AIRFPRDPFARLQPPLELRDLVIQFLAKPRDLRRIVRGWRGILALRRSFGFLFRRTRKKNERDDRPDGKTDHTSDPPVFSRRWETHHFNTIPETRTSTTKMIPCSIFLIHRMTRSSSSPK